MSPLYEHTPFYCEENILRLCAREEFAAARALVAFIFRPDGSVPMWRQRAGAPPEGRLSWDYHVIALRAAAAGWEVWDLDTRLPLPCPAPRYLDASFSPDARDAPLFRLMERETFQRDFRSDRSHMRRGDGTYLAPPPPWPAPSGPGGVSLAELIDAHRASPGRIVSLEDVRRLCG